MAAITLIVTYFAFLLGFGVLVANICKRYSIPDTFFLVILGLVFGPLLMVSEMGVVPDFLRLLALILIVFTGMFNLSFRTFKKFSGVSINLAVIGVVFNTIVFGIAAYFIFAIDWIYAFLLGAIISGTGYSVVATFESGFKHSKQALSVLKIESILNSPLTVLIPVILLDLVMLQPGALIEPLKYATQFWEMMAAGVGTGIIIGLLISKFMKGMLTEYKPLFVFAIALITYAVAENVGGSGMLAVAVCGLIAGNLTFKEKQKTREFEDCLSEMFRISVFALLGAQIVLFFEPVQLLLTVLFFLLIFFSRPIFAIPALGEKLRAEFSKRELILLSLAAPRGIAAAAMAPLAATVLIAAGQTAIASQILNITFYIVLFSIVASSIVAFLVRRSQPKLPEDKLPEKVIGAEAQPYLEVQIPVKAKVKKKIIRSIGKPKKKRKK